MNIAKYSMRTAAAAIVAAFAVSAASAAIVATNNFETAYDDFSVDEGDITSLVSLTNYDNDDPSGTVPAPFSSFGSKYLSLDTDDATVWRSFTEQSGSVYFDSYVKMAPCSGDIEYASDAKFVVFLNADTNLCVISGTSSGVRTPVTNVLATAQIEADSWHRLTVCAETSDSVFAFGIFLDGTQLSSTAGSPIPSSSTFYSLVAGATMSQIGLKGTGAIDDLVVRTTAPVLSGTVAATIDGEDFATLAQAAAEAAAGDTILLESDSSESITLSAAGIVFNTNGKSYTGHVSAASGLGWTEENGVYTSSVNTAATWTGSVDNNWSNPDNWSSHGVPTAATTVTLPDGATIEATGTSALPVDSMIVNGAVKLTCTGDLANNWPSIGIKGSVSGSGTLTLERFGLTSSDADQVTVGCNICFDGKTADSFLQSGSFVLNGSVTGTSKFQLWANTTFNGSVTIPDGATMVFKAKPTFGAGSALSGNGVFSLQGDIDATDTFKNALQSPSWSGICEIYNNTINAYDLSEYGNQNSVVRADILYGYPKLNNATARISGIKALEIAAGGLKFQDSFAGVNVYIDVPITGNGSIYFKTRQNVSSASNLTKFIFTNDMGQFTGTLDLTGVSASASDYRKPIVVFQGAGDALPVPTACDQIVVTENANVTAAGTWNAPGGIVVNGIISVASSGKLTSSSGLSGSGRVVFASIPTAADPPAIADGNHTYEVSGGDYTIGSIVPAWTGTVELPARSGSGEVPLAKLGRAGSRIVVNGITGLDANSIYLSGGTAIDAVVELKGQLKLTNGSTGDNYTFAEVTGSGDMFLSATGSPNSPTFTYTFTKLDNYSGTINAVKTSDSKYAALAIGTVDVLEYVQGKRMVSLSNTCNLTTDPDDIAVSVNGVASTLKLFKADDGNLYVKAASVTTQAEPTYYSTVLAAIQAAKGTGAVVTVCDGTDASIGNFGEYGYVYDNGTWRVGAASVIHDVAGTSTTNAYATLAAAISASVAGDTVMLLQNNAETGINDAGIDTTGKDFVFAENGFAFSGTFTGNGTITVAAVPSSTTWSSARFVANGWTGTFVANFKMYSTQASATTAIKPNLYGISGSTIVIGSALTDPKTFFCANDSSTAPNVAPALYLKADVAISDGFYGTGNVTTFTEVGADNGVTFATRNQTDTSRDRNTYYTFKKLKNFNGFLDVRRESYVKIEEIVCLVAPTAGTRVLATVLDVNEAEFLSLDETKVTVNGELLDVKLVYATLTEGSGLYKAVAQFGGNYYATFQDAIDARAAAGGSGDILVLDVSAPVPEGYRIVDGKLVPNKKPAVLIFF